MTAAQAVCRCTVDEVRLASSGELRMEIRMHKGSDLKFLLFVIDIQATRGFETYCLREGLYVSDSVFIDKLRIELKKNFNTRKQNQELRSFKANLNNR